MIFQESAFCFQTNFGLYENQKFCPMVFAKIVKWFDLRPIEKFSSYAKMQIRSVRRLHRFRRKLSLQMVASLAYKDSYVCTRPKPELFSKDKLHTGSGGASQRSESRPICIFTNFKWTLRIFLTEKCIQKFRWSNWLKKGLSSCRILKIIV